MKQQHGFNWKYMDARMNALRMISIAYTMNDSLSKTG